MVTLTIDGKTVTAQEGTTILEAARANGINIPSLCYLKNINQIAACRICVVEIKGISRLMPACDNQVAEGMEIYTNSPPGTPGAQDQSAAHPLPARLPVCHLHQQRQLHPAEAGQRHEPLGHAL